MGDARPPKRRLAMAARTLRAMWRGPQPRTFPELSAANLPRMHGRVDILRDANGVPHVYAEHEPDLYAAIGFLQGADRAVLLDLLRHLGAGRLAELVGNLSLPKGSSVFSGNGIADLDGFIRPLDFEAQSERDYLRLEARARACLDAYAAGINAALWAMQSVYPPEYLVLGPVRPWRAADALLAAQTCAFTVALAPLDAELAFDAVRGHLGDAGARALYPEAPWENAPATYANVEGPEPDPPLHLAATGSNNWAVSAGRSASGAPLFANDPHVPFLPLPTFWYHAHLECPEYRVQGGLMLGCPVFGFGHNGHLAWGCTTAYRDAWDLYRVHRLPDDRSRYRTASGTQAITKHRTSCARRFGKPTPIEWETCEHGIIYPGWTHHDGVDLALRRVPSNTASYFEGYRALAASRTPEEHQQALALINEGPFDFNHVYAHTNGHIAWEPFGKVPRRRGDGLFVRDAHDPDGTWNGFVPFTEMPKIIRPECGYVASANSITDPTNYRTTTTMVHAEPRHRQNRIESFLAASHQHTVETFAELQRDVGSDYGPRMRDRLVELLDATTLPSDLDRRALDILRVWDGRFDVDSSAAPLYVFTMQELARRTLPLLLGNMAGERFLRTRRGVSRMQRVLADEQDPLRTLVASNGHGLAELVSAAFSAAVSRLAASAGRTPEAWRWGRVQHIRLGTVFGEIPFFGRRFRALDASFPGDHYTVSPAIPLPLPRQVRVFAGATSRFICDLAKPDEAWFAHSSGPSGDIASSFFAGLTDEWFRFRYFRSALWPPAAVPNVVERLTIDNTPLA